MSTLPFQEPRSHLRSCVIEVKVGSELGWFQKGVVEQYRHCNGLCVKMKRHGFLKGLYRLKVTMVIWLLHDHLTHIRMVVQRSRVGTRRIHVRLQWSGTLVSSDYGVLKIYTITKGLNIDTFG